MKPIWKRLYPTETWESQVCSWYNQLIFILHFFAYLKKIVKNIFKSKNKNVNKKIVVMALYKNKTGSFKETLTPAPLPGPPDSLAPRYTISIS